MEAMHEARYYERLPNGELHCALCPHHCHARDGGRGACGVRYAENGTLYSLVYGKVISRAVEPVEKKPLFHFHPGSRAYSIAAVGCSLRCGFCQNWEISQWPKEYLPAAAGEVVGGGTHCRHVKDIARLVPGEAMTPRQAVDAARASGATSIAYTYTEPTVSFEFVYDTALLARRAGLRNIIVTNGFISEAPLRELAGIIDAANVDLKFLDPEHYRHVSHGHIEPVLDAIRLYHELGVWVEVTTLIVPEINDDDTELKDIAAFVRGVGPEVPWHVSRFYPAWKMLDHPITPVATLLRARELGRAAGLRYVYAANIGDMGHEDTRCPHCLTLLIERQGLRLRANHLAAGACPACGTTVDGVGMAGTRGLTAVSS
jgi:pyruvate formate lyase activating enzyme